ncbi:zinc finger CCHC-type and RNA-binding motif-containing protein 1-like [Gossypium australe]|uniref:Zinc finger CCHC-type and RNA-binding motif-containing protein 1-like n=1 Tax=Gossypium australe TaxID=47621 RepID=A0A5B6VYA3_9ROSI|nr:zinc finger CCHC-type and RNA-binding motif-containing protein 1-like [Gossypium australe]
MSHRFTYIINEVKVTTIEEYNDLNSLSLDELIGSLLTYEIKINYNVQEIKEAQKKVGVAFKSTTGEKDGDSSNNDEEEEMAMFAKKFKKFMKFNKAKRFTIRDIIKGEPSKKEKEPIICYECKKSGHIKFDCPQLKKKEALKQNKKAMMATWRDNDSSDSDKDNEVANLCLMAIEEPKEEEHCFKANNSKKNSWYLDSGCSRHMTGDKSHFMELMPKNGGEVTFGDNSKGLIEGIGSIGINSSTLIKNVLYVNGLKHNLLSISQLCDKGFKVIFESNGCKVVDIVNNIILFA